MRSSGLWLFALACALLAGCGPQPRDEKNVGINTATSCPPVNYQNGVYYFPCNMATFANAVSDFVEKNKNLRIVAVTGDETAGHGTDQGYFVFAEEREKR